MDNLKDLENYFVGILGDLQVLGIEKTWLKIETIKDFKLRINCRKYFFEIGGR